MIIYVSKKYLCICVSIYQEISLLISNVFPSNYSFFPFVVWSLNCVCPALCESMDCSMPGFPVLHYLLDFAQTHVHWFGEVMPCNHFILCHPLHLLPSVFLSIRVFSNESALHIRWPKYQSFSFSISPSSELISIRIDWFDHLVVQGTLKSLLQHHSSKASCFSSQNKFQSFRNS